LDEGATAMIGCVVYPLWVKAVWVVWLWGDLSPLLGWGLWVYGGL